MTTERAKDKEFQEGFVRHGKARWPVYVVALVLTAIGILVERRVPGISRSIGSGGAAVLGTIATKHRYYRFTWFWITFAVLVMLQIPLMILTKPLMDSLKFAFMWVLAFVDLLAMSFAIEIVADRFDEDKKE